GAAELSTSPTLVRGVPRPWGRSILLPTAVTGSDSAASSSCAHGPPPSPAGGCACACAGKGKAIPRSTVMPSARMSLIAVPLFFPVRETLSLSYTQLPCQKPSGKKAQGLIVIAP